MPLPMWKLATGVTKESNSYVACHPLGVVRQVDHRSEHQVLGKETDRRDDEDHGDAREVVNDAQRDGDEGLDPDIEVYNDHA